MNPADLYSYNRYSTWSSTNILRPKTSYLGALLYAIHGPRACAAAVARVNSCCSSEVQQLGKCSKLPWLKQVTLSPQNPKPYTLHPKLYMDM